MFKAAGSFARRVASATKTSLAVLGFATASASVATYWQIQNFVKEESKDKKRVLVLPFPQLKVVHSRDPLRQFRTPDADSIEEVEVNDLVDIIHEAAGDPNIVAIFGEFGHGRSFDGGMADAEEIKNALQVID